MHGAAFSLALLLCALYPVAVYFAAAGEEEPQDEHEDDCAACVARGADPEGGIEDMSWPSFTRTRS